MVRRTSWIWVLLLALTVGAAGCKLNKEEPVEEADVLDLAIMAQGGAAVLKQASSFSARYEGGLYGGQVKANIQYRAGDVRLSYKNLFKDTDIIQVSADGKCWQQIDKAVLPCIKERAEHASRLAKMFRASWLWPLKGKGGLSHKSTEIKLTAKTYDALVISDDSGEIGTLLVDKNEARVVGMKMQTKLNGKAGELVATFSNFKKECGVMVPADREYTFDGKPFASGKISGVVCEKVEAKVFDQPKPPKIGVTDLRHTADATLACIKHKGPLTGVKDALTTLVQERLNKYDIAPVGPVYLVHRKGPPRVRKPKGYVTDVCFPVSDDTWKMDLPDDTWKGKYSLFVRRGDEYLRTFTVGDFAKTTDDAIKLLVKDAKEMKRSPSGQFVQILYMLGDDFPAEKRLAEVQMPIYPG